MRNSNVEPGDASGSELASESDAGGPGMLWTLTLICAALSRSSTLMLCITSGMPEKFSTFTKSQVCWMLKTPLLPQITLCGDPPRLRALATKLTMLVCPLIRSPMLMVLPPGIVLPST